MSRLQAALACSLLVIALALARGAAAQTSADPMGVDEHLGATAPLGLTLVDEAGQKVRLGSLIDRPTLLTLNYFTCAGLCTPQLNGIANLLDQIGIEPGQDFRVLTVSFDPRDTPETAARKRENLLAAMKRPVPAAAWRFLTGDARSTKSLADAVGFEFQSTGDAFIHPAVAVMLTADGRISRYIHGTSFVPADVQMAVAEAARGQVTPTIPTAPQNCRTSEAPGRDYARRFVRIAGLATLAGAGLLLAGIFWHGSKGKQKGAIQ